MTTTKIPRFKTLEEARAFWDTHDSADYQDQMRDARVAPAPARSEGQKRMASSYAELVAALESVLRDAAETALIGRKRVRAIGPTTYRKARAALRRALEASRNDRLERATGSNP